MSWQTLTLLDICKRYNGKIQTGPFGSQLHQKDYQESGVPVIMPKDIVGNGVSTDGIARIGEKDVDRLKKHKVVPGDIVFPRRGEINKRAFITTNEEGFLCGTGCLKISIQSNEINNKYLNFFLGLRESVSWLENNAVGSTMKNLSGEIIGKFPVRLPDISTQHKIASILSAYDDLIENNLKRIKLLEEAGQNIYKEWFVNFRINGEELEVNKETGLPEGWNHQRADSLFDIAIGKTPPRQESHWFNQQHIPGKKWVSIGDINKASTYILSTQETVTDDAVSKFNMRVAPKGTVILSFKLTIGRVAIAGEDIVTNEAIAHFNRRQNDNQSQPFLYLYLKSFPFDSLGSTSSIGRAINSKVVRSMPILTPTAALLKDFCCAVSPFFTQIENLSKQNRILVEGRDLLLPRLMNGSIEV